MKPGFMRRSIEEKKRNKGAVSVGVAVVMLIVLTVSMGLVSRCAQNLVLAENKIEYRSHCYRLQSAQVVFRLKLEEYLAVMVKAAAKDTRTANVSADSERSEKNGDLTEIFEEKLRLRLQSGGAIALQDEVDDENFGHLEYEIKEYEYLKERGDVLVRTKIYDPAYDTRSVYEVYYTIRIKLPGEAAVRYLKENEIDALAEEYKKNLREELHYMDR